MILLTVGKVCQIFLIIYIYIYIYIYTHTHIRGPVHKFVHLKRNCGPRGCSGTGASLSPSSVPPPNPSHCTPRSPVCQQPHSRCLRSQALTAPALLTPADGMERFGPVPSVGASGSCWPQLPLKSRGWWRSPQCWQPPLVPTDGTK
uniref:Uncharacterized protein n=1 Tax=Myotis myotis TaxID=51298 RepID=A0A7J7Z4V7_MYOMY|nr:hypothetical protein mMyoMyo1_010630 [Myotis myotis]